MGAACKNQTVWSKVLHMITYSVKSFGELQCLDEGECLARGTPVYLQGKSNDKFKEAAITGIFERSHKF